MDWQDKLIKVYCTVWDYWDQGVDEYVKRMSNNQELELTDQDIMTIYINAVMKNRHTVKNIYEYTSDHLRNWFPKLASYEAFAYRLNQIHGAFSILAESILSNNFKQDKSISRKYFID